MLPDAATFEAWLRGREGFQQARVASIEPAEGGASNITCRVALEGAVRQAVALRVQRARGIFEPYDVVREGRVLLCLAQSNVPVPEVVALEPDPGPLGAPFIVMEWIEAPHMGIAGAEADFEAYTSAVVAVHNVPWEDLGLGFLGVPSSASDASLSELAAVERRMGPFGCATDPALCEALQVLRESIPGDGRIGLVQGDINIFNYLFRNRVVVGVVDWEQAHLGDRRSDIGQLVALAHLKGAPFGPAGEMPFVQMYQRASGERLQRMEFFRARWLWELAIIYHGWKAFNVSEPWYGRDEVYALLERALGELRPA